MIGNNLRLFCFFSSSLKKMDVSVEFYNDWKKIEGFILYQKKSISWICLVNDEYKDTCAVHRFLFLLEETISKAKWEDKIDEFVLFAKKAKRYLNLFMSFMNFL